MCGKLSSRAPAGSRGGGGGNGCFTAGKWHRDYVVAVAESRQLRSVEEFRGGPQGFHARLGFDESTLSKQTNAVYGMGTRYRGLSEQAETVFVPLGYAWHDAAACRFSSLCCQVACRGGRAGLSTTGRSLRLRPRTGRFDPAQTGVEPALRLLEYDLYVDHDSYLATMLKHASSHGVRIVNRRP